MYDLLDESDASIVVGTGATETSLPKAYLSYIHFDENSGGKRIVVQKGNKTFDITKDRVKEYVKNPRNPNSRYGDAVNFKKAGTPEGSQRLTGAKSGKGHKRSPTLEEIKMLNNAGSN